MMQGLQKAEQPAGGGSSLEPTDQESAAIMEKVLLQGDLAPLKPRERVLFYRMMCQSVGLNPLTRPFEYIVFQGKLQLYLRKEAAEQLAGKNNVSVQIVSERETDTHIRIRVRGTRGNQVAEATGAVSLMIDTKAGTRKARGQEIEDCFMKAETKAFRRLILRLLGLSLPDVDAGNGGTEVVKVDPSTGEIMDAEAKQIGNPVAGEIEAPDVAEGEAQTPELTDDQLVEEARKDFWGQARDLKLLRDGRVSRRQVHTTLGLACKCSDEADSADCHVLSNRIEELVKTEGKSYVEAWGLMGDLLAEKVMEGQEQPRIFD